MMPPASGKMRSRFTVLQPLASGWAWSALGAFFVLALGCATNATDREANDLRFDLIEAEAAEHGKAVQERHDALALAAAKRDTALGELISDTALALRSETRKSIVAVVASGVAGRRGLSVRLDDQGTEAVDAGIAGTRSRAGLSERIAIQRVEIVALRNAVNDLDTDTRARSAKVDRLHADTERGLTADLTHINTVLNALPTRSWTTEKINASALEARPSIVAEAKELTTVNYSTIGVGVAALLTALGAMFRVRSTGGNE